MIINFIVLRCRNISYVKLAILVIIHCSSEQSYLGVRKGGKKKKGKKISYKWDLVLPWETAACQANET